MTVARQLVQPGLEVQVTKTQDGQGLVFALNEHEVLFGRAVPLEVNEVLHVLSVPRKRDGISLVRVRRQNGDEGEVSYTHLNSLCTVHRIVMRPPNEAR